jgi:hypothetical protein
VSALVAGGFMFLSLRVNRDDRIRAHKAEQEASAKIEALELAARPKPFTERLITFLSALDSRIITGLATNSVEWSGLLRTNQYAEFESLLHENDSEKYIGQKLFKEQPLQMTNAGTLMHGVTFVVQQQLLKDAKHP